MRIAVWDEPALDFLARAAEELAEHHQQNAGVEQNDARAPLEDKQATTQQHDAYESALDELPQNAQRRIGWYGCHRPDAETSKNDHRSQQTHSRLKRCVGHGEANSARDRGEEQAAANSVPHRCPTERRFAL